MKTLILERLEKIAKNQQIKILYACESGSRAWGFASPDSDWDVRFIYAYRKDRYLSIDPISENINLPIDENDLDIAGWELRKTLRLFRTSNASPYEWLQSPIIYKDPYGFREKLWKLSKSHFLARATAYHYFGLSKKSLASMKGNKINIKKYFYVLRPLLAALWIIEKQEPAPMAFDPLLGLIQSKETLLSKIVALKEEKKKALEGQEISVVPEIQNFILEKMDYCARCIPSLPLEKSPNAVLNDLFRWSLDLA